MILDNTLVFSNGQSLITNASTGSTFIIDLAAGGSTSSTTYPTGSNLNLTFGNAATFGEDLGIGDGAAALHVGVYAGTALVTANSATLQVQFQGSADVGGGTVASLSWTTYVETDALAGTVLTANTAIAKLWWPHRQVAAALPRFVRLNYLVATGTFTAGTVSAYVMQARYDWTTGNYPSNFVVAS